MFFVICEKLQLIGDSAIAQSVTSKGYIDASEFLTINVGWGLGLIVALYISIGVTGGHLNPAVTFAMALRGKTSWLKVWNIILQVYMGIDVGFEKKF